MGGDAGRDWRPKARQRSPGRAQCRRPWPRRLRSRQAAACVLSSRVRGGPPPSGAKGPAGRPPMRRRAEPMPEQEPLWPGRASLPSRWRAAVAAACGARWRSLRAPPWGGSQLPRQGPCRRAKLSTGSSKTLRPPYAALTVPRRRDGRAWTERAAACTESVIARVYRGERGARRSPPTGLLAVVAAGRAACVWHAGSRVATPKPAESSAAHHAAHGERPVLAAPALRASHDGRRPPARSAARTGAAVRRPHPPRAATCRALPF